MNGIIKFRNNKNNTENAERNLSVLHGVLLIPSKGDVVKNNGFVYTVTSILWDFDKQLITVYAKA